MVNYSTFVVRGKDGTYLGLSFGDGRQAQQLNLYDYLPAHAVPHLSNFVFDLTGILPDAFGLDIGVAGGFEINNPFASKGSAGGVGLAGVGASTLSGTRAATCGPAIPSCIATTATAPRLAKAPLSVSCRRW